MALLVLLLCRELFGFASHSRGDPLITNDVLYQLSYSGVPARVGPILFSSAGRVGARMGRRHMPIPVCAPFPALRRHRRLV
jgi:hypothetical protein